MIIFKEILESKTKIEKAKLYYNSKNYDLIYTATDGKGNYSLVKDKSVFWADSKDNSNLTVDGKPNAKIVDYAVMEFMGKFGIWDSNMKLYQGYKNMKEFLNDKEEIEQEIDLEW